MLAHFLDAVFAAVSNHVTQDPTIYAVKNLLNVLCKLPSSDRNVAGSPDVDQIIEETAQMDRASGSKVPACMAFGGQDLWSRSNVDAGPPVQYCKEETSGFGTIRRLLFGPRQRNKRSVIDSKEIEIDD
jgi:hypothetical protein